MIFQGFMCVQDCSFPIPVGMWDILTCFSFLFICLDKVHATALLLAKQEGANCEKTVDKAELKYGIISSYIADSQGKPT